MTTESTSATAAPARLRSEQLLPLVYDELRKLAASRLRQEAPGQTIQPTALVHEVYLRLIDPSGEQRWESPGHFFAAAAEAMRRILINRARDKKRLKRGGDRQRLDLDRVEVAFETPPDEILEVDEAITKLALHDPRCAELVKLRFYAGLSLDEAAYSLGVSSRTADGLWAYGRAWLYQRLSGDAQPER
jgi:RNA polymerase sigma factor (TIGR02999 family)